jgi:hypothetical protein
MAKPVLVLVDDEDASRQELTREPESRYGAHDRIVASPSPEAALGRLRESRAEDVAVGGSAQRRSPFAGWLPDAIHRDQWGFILTGPDAAPHWPLQRAPFLFETTAPGVFAVGDVRHGSVKRVASAVGEGSVTIRLVHDYLAAP